MIQLYRDFSDFRETQKTGTRLMKRTVTLTENETARLIACHLENPVIWRTTSDAINDAIRCTILERKLIRMAGF